MLSCFLTVGSMFFLAFAFASTCFLGFVRGQLTVKCFTELQVVQVLGAEEHRDIVCPIFLQNEQIEGSHGLETVILLISPVSN